MKPHEPRYACIHGHFYQPPRENPWLEAVEVEDSAAPYHDWNERIAAECYAANAAARLQTSEGRLTAIVCNYERISFNFGPTLLTWMEKADPATYRAILEADRASVARLGGHGNAIAQAYNHVILPLASPRDRATQVRWGKADFEKRFGREPEGMWLPEAAVDTPTLEALAEEGMRFAILSPRQAEAVALPDDDEWTAVDEHSLDPAAAYRCELPSGREVALFFYDGPMAQAIAFGGLLYDGGAFAGRLADLAATADPDAGPRLAHVATDGESYGHHHRFGDMALAYALRRLEEEGVEPVNYARFLELSPPRRRVRIRERSSWSCFHGVERWRADCGCKTGGPAHWSQAWRGALRGALDGLKERLDAVFEGHGGRVLADPWAARDAYVRVVLDRSPASVDAFLAEQGKGTLDPAGQVAALRALEMQRNGMLMFTSCGWFFDDMAGLEAVQVMKYACRAARLGAALSGEDLEGPLVRALAAGRSNQPGEGDGESIYRRRVQPLAVDLRRVAAHHAITRMLEADSTDERDVYAYAVRRLEGSSAEHGGTRLVTGRFRVTSRLTRDSTEVALAMLYFGGHDFRCGVRADGSPGDYRELRRALFETFDRRSLSDVVTTLERHFSGDEWFSLRDAFLEERRGILDCVVHDTLQTFRTAHLRFYREHGRLLGYLAEANYPLPDAFRSAAAYGLAREAEVVVERLARAAGEDGATETLREDAHRLAAQALEWGVRVTDEPLRRKLTEAVLRQIRRFGEEPSAAPLAALHALLDLGRDLGVDFDLWRVQNDAFGILTEPSWPSRIASADEEARIGVLESAMRLGDRLHFVLERVSRG
ncbi:MAG: DUF3536 domain-containing protein [Deltaproteobacteria bacterium]|nr:DUF3536 domain-containing protein [Deltaproteobacteria bacterium]